MNGLLHSVVIVLGLVVFETISSIDNATINAHILKTMSDKYRKFFLTFGLIFAVFAARGCLPFLALWLVNPTMSFVEIWHLAFSGSEEVALSIEHSKPLLLLGSGVYLLFVSVGWLFKEKKEYAFRIEKTIHRHGEVFFLTFASLFLAITVFCSIKHTSIAYLPLSAAIGSSLYFLADGFRESAEHKERELAQPGSHVGALSKLIYLEILDLSFSIDGVLGAFAFTTSITLILIGNGLGALLVRELTIRGVEIIGRLKFLKNGAMYSIGVLGTIMVVESFGLEAPFWLAPLASFSFLGIFLYLSLKHERQVKRAIKVLAES